jgi:hypothetical protein
MDTGKTKLARHIEVVTNLSIIVVALIGASVLVKNYLIQPRAQAAAEARPSVVTSTAPENQRREPPKGPNEGTQISIPDVDWSGSKQTILLALSNKCHFCTESAPFYQRLSSELAQRQDVKLLAVFPQDNNEAKQYLSGLGIQIANVKQATLDSIGVRGTPTLMIVDASGKVKQAWVGKLTPEKESEVLNRIKA